MTIDLSIGSPLLAFLAEFSLKATVLLGGVLVLSAVMRKAAAATRHSVLSLSMTLLLFLPILLFGPKWPVPGLVAQSTVAKADAVDPLAIYGNQRRSALPRHLVPEGTDPAAARPLSHRVSSAALTAARSWETWLAAWGLGVGIVGWRLGRALWRARAIVRTARRWSSPETAELEERLGIKGGVRYLISDGVSVPATCGIVTPTVLLPRAFDTWSVERRRIVLLHELAHVDRRDCLVQLVAGLAVALYWFHPLAWMTRSWLRREAEEAADDLVLASGTSASSYAGHLLAIVRSLQPSKGPALAAVPISGSSFEDRVRAILAPDRRRSPMRRWMVSATVIILAALAMVLAAAGVSADDPPEPRHAERHHHEHHSGHGWAKDKVKRAIKHAYNKEGRRAFESGYELHSEGRYDEAREKFNESIDRGFKPAVAAYNIACGHALQGNTRDAFYWLERAIDDGFHATDYLDDDSDLRSLRGDPRFARLRENAEAMAQARRYEKQREEREEAITEYRELEADGTADGDDWYEVGMDLHHAGEHAMALNAWERTVELGHEPAKTTYNMACAHAVQGDHSRALRTLENAVQLGYGNAEYFDEDDDLRSLRGDEQFDEIRELARAYELPGDVSGKDFNREAWEEAASRYEKLTHRRSDVGRSWFHLGLARLRLGEHRGAERAFKQALGKDFRPMVTMYNLACTHSMAGHADEAIDWLNKAVEAGFDQPWMLENDPDLENIRHRDDFPKIEHHDHGWKKRMEKGLKRMRRQAEAY